MSKLLEGNRTRSAIGAVALFGAPDYREWCKIVALNSEEEKISKFKKIWQFMSDYCEGEPLRLIVEENMWLKEEILGAPGLPPVEFKFDQAVQSFREDP